MQVVSDLNDLQTQELHHERCCCNLRDQNIMSRVSHSDPDKKLSDLISCMQTDTDLSDLHVYPQHSVPFCFGLCH